MDSFVHLESQRTPITSADKSLWSVEISVSAANLLDKSANTLLSISALNEPFMQQSLSPHRIHTSTPVINFNMQWCDGGTNYHDATLPDDVMTVCFLLLF